MPDSTIPKKGIDPCAILPLVSISVHHTPLCPRQILSLFNGSGIIRAGLSWD